MSPPGGSSKTTTTIKMPPSISAPSFATFLLPSFSLPFRRRRLPSPTRRPSVDDTASSLVPSLSSSPASTYTSDPASPIEPTSSFPLDFTNLEHSNPFPTTTLARIQPDTIRCGICASDLAFGAQIVSKGFHGRHGRAYLVSPPSSLSTSPPVPGLFPSFQSHTYHDEDGHEVAGSELANIRIGQPEKRQLVTGQHTVADINCAVCGAKLGWKYVDAKEVSQKYKVGKFILETQRVIVYRSWEDGGGRTDRGVIEPGDLAEFVDSLHEDDEEPVVVFDSEDEDECDDIFSGTWNPTEVAQRRRSRVGQRMGKRSGFA